MMLDWIDVLLAVALAVLITVAITKPKWRKAVGLGIFGVLAFFTGRRVPSFTREEQDSEDNSNITDADPTPREPHLDIPKYEDKTSDIVNRPTIVLTGNELDSELDELELRARRERERREAGLSE